MPSFTARCSIAATAFALACFAFASPAQISAVRFDGVYQAPVGDGLVLYFRFYPDGSVVSVPSTGTPMQVARWLRHHLELGGDGSYSVSGDMLRLRVAARRGDIDYWGTIGRDSLHLSSYSHFTKRRDERQYKFVPVRFGK